MSGGNTFPKAHSWIDDLKAYVPGRAAADGIAEPVKLSANESTYGASPKAIAAYRDCAEDINRYPDGGSLDLVDAIAEVHDLEADQIVCGSGSDDILTLLINAYAGTGSEVIHCKYGFSVYPIVTKAVGGTPVAVPNKDWAADVDGILAAVTENTKLVFIDNPNNPTGAVTPWSEIERLHAGLRSDIVLVLDAAYGECVTDEDYQAGEALVRKADNVIMTRTFSKMYALAGLRVGWAYGAPNIIEVLQKMRMPFNVCLPAQRAAIEAVKDQAHLKAAVDFNNEWRDQMTAELSALGLDVVPSHTNFLLVGFPTETPFTAEEAYNFMTENGYLLRYFASQGLENHVRITIGSAQENRAVIQLLKQFMNGSSQG